MADQNPIRGLASLQGFAAVLTLVASVLYVQDKLVSQRPRRDTSTVPAPANAILARLWEDPLEALEIANRKEKPTPCSLMSFIFGDLLPHTAKLGHTLEQEIQVHLHADNGTSGQAPPKRQVRVLAVMVRSGTDEESHEHRIRTRHALQAALRISGYNAAHEDQLGVVDVSLGDANHKKVTFTTPIECFVSDRFGQSARPQDGASNANETPPTKTIVVIWLSADDFIDKPLWKLRSLYEQVISQRAKRVSGQANWSSIVADIRHCLHDCFPPLPSTSTSVSASVSKSKVTATATATVVSPTTPTSTSSRAANDVEMTVIGPADSTMLRTMLEGATESPKDQNTSGLTIPLYSPFCTAEPALLCRGLTSGTRWEDVASLLKDVGFEYRPTIGPDDVLAHELIDELLRRGVKIAGRAAADDDVAIISEWDTFYGRAFPITFAAAMSQHRTNYRSFAEEFDAITKEGQMPANLKVFSYMRGIDGRTLNNAKEPAALEAKEQSARATELGDVLGQSGVPEIPLGENQFDYIRRLVQRIRESYPRTGCSRLRAIGVVGTDVYDKLLVLQALREQFDDVLFFTTDLDARLFHRDQYALTRNLLVASSYGLRLNDSLQRGSYQGDLSQFRDVYQTSFFVACRMALGSLNGPREEAIDHKTLQKALLAPRVFEIGRDQAIDLSMTPGSEHQATAVARIHPPRYTFTWQCGWWLILLVTIFVGGVLAGVTTDIFDRWFGPGGRLSWVYVAPLLIFAAFLIAFIFYDQYQDGGEPFLLTSGTSIWPAVILRLVALGLGLWLFGRYRDYLHRSGDKLRAMCRPADAAPAPRDSFWKELWEAIKLLWNWRTFRPSTWHDPTERLSVARDDQRFPDATALFAEYRTRGKLRFRIARTIGCVLVFLFFSMLVSLLWGLPANPYRGQVSWWFGFVSLWLAVLVFVSLLMFAVDATRLCKWFIETICRPNNTSEAPLEWPDDAFAAIEPEFQTEHSGAAFAERSPRHDARVYPEFNELFLIRAIAERTKAVQKGVVFSSVVLLILIIARSGLFDAWNWPYGLIAVFCMGFGYAFWSLYEMTSLASRERERSLARLEQIHLARLSDSSPREAADRVAKVATLIRENRIGAFASFWENPILKSVLIPTGGLSALALLQFLIGAK